MTIESDKKNSFVNKLSVVGYKYQNYSYWIIPAQQDEEEAQAEGGWQTKSKRTESEIGGALTLSIPVKVRWVSC